MSATAPVTILQSPFNKILNHVSPFLRLEAGGLTVTAALHADNLCLGIHLLQL